MKYLENLSLEKISKNLNQTEIGGGLLLTGRIEMYSTKKTSDDKKYSKMLESKLRSSSITGEEISPQAEIGVKHFERSENTKHVRKLLLDLIQTLNAAQMDYDFSQLTIDDFRNTPLQDAIQFINSQLAEITVVHPNFINNMWKDIALAFDDQLQNCEAYYLLDSSDIDDLDEGYIWSFHYFLCSKELKRICYFTCNASPKIKVLTKLSEDFSDDDMEIDEDGESSYNNLHEDSDGGYDETHGEWS